MKNGKYYFYHYKNVLQPLFVSKYNYLNLFKLPYLQNIRIYFNVLSKKNAYLPVFQYFWGNLFLVKKQNLFFYIKKEIKQIKKKKIISIFAFRLNKTHLFFLLEQLIFVGFGSILTNPFLLKKQGGLSSQLFFNKFYYQLLQAYYWPEEYALTLLLNDVINVQCYFSFKKNSSLLVLEKWNVLKLLNIPVYYK